MLKILFDHMHGWARVSFFLAPIAIMGEALLDLQQPTLMARIVDVGLARKDMTYVWQTAILMAVIAVAAFALGAICNAFSSYAALKMGQNLRSHMLAIALADRDPQALKPETLITRITNDVTQMQTMVSMLTRGLIRSPMLLFGGIVMSMIVSPRLSWIVLIALPILAIYIYVVVRRSLPLYTAMQGQVDVMNRIMSENLTGAKTIKAYVLEDHQRTQFNTENHNLQQISQRAVLATVTLAPLIMLVLNLAVVAALAYGGNLAISGSMTTGEIMAFVNYMIQITTAMTNTVNLITTFSRAVTSSARVSAVLAEQAGTEATGTLVAPADSTIAFNHVTFGFSKSRPILDDINLTVPSGQWLGIIGSTGSGKTTLIALLTRLYEHYQGSITIGGTDIQKISLASLHKKITVALQNSLLFSGTVERNLDYGAPQATPAQLASGVAIASATEFIGTDYTAPVEEAGKNFSGGQRQRLNLARAIIPDPDILVMDDATSAVDQETNTAIQDALIKNRRNRSTIIISQRVPNIMDCDQIIVMQNGRITARGTHDELVKSSPFYAQLVQTQLGGEYLD
ncbi:ABC transporter ATP-binding protein [Lacticaseibacillus zeae]|uniref:ABC transporter ATP-binding protein n=1 Tax=Lacticaseibacillus zeae subsp. silagei TaxID=3068307 RepID=A0ABD7ZB19_LACZE|nr:MULTISPECIES: ABC transporter ATP-binding protein [Lacticaseibacillus]MDE3314454.1 ABC transporter ATP-binding protein/permease [Lacticaseibacillus zeae]WLV84080.1 ABC transporter ATP-binding protein [Lacticaseibacillus sp. NCIMB 15475]WLV86835.1 ABC transporter ATP-binding protein [Lacticaseibacillus sp. NCIMB 15474]